MDQICYQGENNKKQQQQKRTSATTNSCMHGKSHKALYMLNNMLNLHPQVSTCI